MTEQEQDPRPANFKSELKAVIMLHRHGSRGPGESELSCWDGETSICSEWQPDEIECITPFGKLMMTILGRWFGTSYQHNLNHLAWYCSKSLRARESGYDFMQSLNTHLNALECSDPTEYCIDADWYFRPWKLFHCESKAIKSSIDKDTCWHDKCADNSLFLKEICQKIEMKKQICDSLPRSLWAMTYVHNILECELFWPNEVDNAREALSAKITDISDRIRVQELACWVWSQRFLVTSHRMLMGGRLCCSVLQSLLNDEAAAVYSGHDYTILGLLGVLGVAGDQLSWPLQFGCYLLFEMWSSCPPALIYGSDAPLQYYDESVEQKALRLLEQTEATHLPGASSCSGNDTRILRIVLNPAPFHPALVETDHIPVHQDKTRVVALLNSTEIRQLIADIKEHFSQKGIEL